MIIDGKKIAEEIKSSLREEVLALDKSAGRRIQLAIVKVGDDAITEKFLERKKKFADEIGIFIKLYTYSKDITHKQLSAAVSSIVRAPENLGVIVQLPLPEHINTQYIVNIIDPKKDPDMLSSKSFELFAAEQSEILPPVVGAISHIFSAYGIPLRAKNVVVVGAGRLVGKPVAQWLSNQSARVTMLDIESKEISSFIRSADVIISGVGKPNLITPDMVKDNAIVIDAGSSDVAGQLRGDVVPAVAEKASLFTPVPGGVGPITIAMLFSNLVQLAKRR